ncbi:MAG TPA: PorP/SprF family type IX secretion system membrane protein [Chryseosolibacter sp.]
MKIKIAFVCLFGVVSMIANAQYIPNNAQGYQFMSLFNPAFSGVENFDELKFGYRYQWAGFGAGSPKFVNLAFHKRIKQPLDMTYNSMRVSDFSSANTARLPRGKRMIHSLGANLFQSSIGVIKGVGGALTYSVHYPITNYTRLAFGATGLIENRKLDVSEVVVRDPDEFYNYLMRSSTSQTDLNLRVGALVYGERYYFGASYLPLVNIALQASDLAMEEPFYRASFQGGLSFPVTSEVSIKPSVLGLLQMNNNLVMDYNLKAIVQNKVIGGLSYRSIESIVVLMGFNINETFTATYSYEASVGQFRKFNDGSHELVLTARFNNLKKLNTYLW